MMLANMQERLESNDLSMHKPRKLLGIVRSSEKLRDLMPCDEDDASGSGQNKAGKAQSKAGNRNRSKRREKPKAKPPQQHHHHALQGMQKGDRCSSCNASKLYKYTPAVLLRVKGNAPLSCEKHVAEQMRCSSCGEIYTAELPEHVIADGPRYQQYGYSVRQSLPPRSLISARSLPMR